VCGGGEREGRQMGGRTHIPPTKKRPHLCGGGSAQSNFVQAGVRDCGAPAATSFLLDEIPDLVNAVEGEKKQQQQQWPPAEHAALRPMCPLLSGMLVGDGALSGDMAHCSAVRCRLRHRGELVLLENTIELSLVAPAVSTEGPCVHVASTCSVVAVPKYRIRSP
jgi:hypothetical protein